MGVFGFQGVFAPIFKAHTDMAGGPQSPPWITNQLSLGVSFFSARGSPNGGHRIPTTFPFVCDSDLVNLGFLIGRTICFIMAILYAHNCISFEKMPQKDVFPYFGAKGLLQRPGDKFPWDRASTKTLADSGQCRLIYKFALRNSSD